MKLHDGKPPNSLVTVEHVIDFDGSSKQEYYDYLVSVKDTYGKTIGVLTDDKILNDHNSVNLRRYMES
jgi:hypothetical protein